MVSYYSYILYLLAFWCIHWGPKLVTEKIYSGWQYACMSFWITTSWRTTSCQLSTSAMCLMFWTVQRLYVCDFII